MSTNLLEKREIRESVVFENCGEKMFGLLHRPLSEVAEAVLLFHGFASHKVGTNRSHVKLAQNFAENNIAAFRFDFRGSGDSEGDISRLGYDDFLLDAEKAIGHMIERGYSKIGIFGSSIGGSLAISVANKFPEIKALAVWAPVASGEMWMRDFLKRMPQATSLKEYQGVSISEQFQKQFLRMKAFEDLLLLSKIPFLHFQGDKDETLSLDHRRAFEKSREKALSMSRFLLYPENSHYFGYSSCFQEVLKESIEWFKRYLKH